MMPMARTTTELASMLAYRLRERLGTAVDYRATLLPNEMAIQVEMILPERLRGYIFIFREMEGLPGFLNPPEMAIPPLTYAFNDTTRTWANVTTAGMMAQVQRVDDIIGPDTLILNQTQYEVLNQVMATDERITGGTRTMAPDATATAIGQTVTN